jgi:hypothetical protein
LSIAFLDQWQRPQVLSIQKQQIERDEQGLTPAEEKITKHCAASLIDACDLAIKYGAFDF